MSEQQHIAVDSLPQQGGWFICEVIDTFESFGAGCKTHTAVIGEKGYVRRNKFDKNYVQVVAKTTRGSVAAFYLHVDDARYKLWITKLAPLHARPYVYWQGFWQAWRDA